MRCRNRVAVTDTAYIKHGERTFGKESRIDEPVLQDCQGGGILIEPNETAIDNNQ
jgi:hypothetical protein